MFTISLFSFLKTYISDSNYTNALIKGLKKDELEMTERGGGIKDMIGKSLRIKEEGKQLYFLADYIKREAREEFNETYISPFKENDDSAKTRANRLEDFIGDIYEKIDYYEVAKQLTKYYKEQQKTNIKKVA
jgi:hypothetical protein